jgi:UDP-N-acetylmuramoyl-L-alanyl-D-glutamate--2,6-diaminopimelate ligase
VEIKTNSKEVTAGDIFIAIKGMNRDGHDFVNDAIKRGASKVVVEYGDYLAETVYVKDTKQYLIDYLKNNYYEKIKDLKLIGVTGTNGKTTSCFLIYQMLNKMKISCAYIGTIGFYLKDSITKLDNTTPDILEMYNLLLKCKDEGIEYVAMEVSSHALELRRVAGLEFDYAIFTNLSVDHLDFHHNIENYVTSKEKLFHQVKDNGLAIINNDDPYKDRMMIHNNNITYGFNKSDYQILNYTMDSKNTTFDFIYNNDIYTVNTSVVGKYNIYNLLTMLIVLHKEGISLEELIGKVPILKAPPGRMDIISYNNNSIIVDYAHTPDAIFSVLNTIKEFSNGRIYSIIGCGGNRDRSKRNKMTFYATTLSDMVIITSDNPRNEDVNDIIADMLKDIVKTNYQIITDRKEAIEYGVKLLDKDDILVILGKGHEDYQIIGDQKLYHNDKEYVLKLCR